MDEAERRESRTGRRRAGRAGALAAALGLVLVPRAPHLPGPGDAAFVQFAPTGVPGIPPSAGCTSQPEGHYCAQTAPESRALRAAFYRSALGGGTPVIGGP